MLISETDCRWPDVEAELKKWITYHRNGGILMPSIIIVFRLRQWQVTQGNTDFAGKTWQYRFMKRQAL
jgi:hypothetical protein